MSRKERKQRRKSNGHVQIAHLPRGVLQVRHPKLGVVRIVSQGVDYCVIETNGGKSITIRGNERVIPG